MMQNSVRQLDYHNALQFRNWPIVMKFTLENIRTNVNWRYNTQCLTYIPRLGSALDYQLGMCEHSFCDKENVYSIGGDWFLIAFVKNCKQSYFILILS